MVYGYHVIMPMYGFWLPNDPRGSWSEFIRSWEIGRFGHTTKSRDRLSLDQLTEDQLRQRAEVKRALRYPPVSIDGQQALTIALAIKETVERNNYTVWGCAILPEHTHMVIARHSYRVEQIINLIKGRTTRKLNEVGNHPLAAYTKPAERTPRMWASGQWKQFLDTESGIENAIKYVHENPSREGKKRQHWSFVKPFGGIDGAGWTTYH